MNQPPAPKPPLLARFLRSLVIVLLVLAWTALAAIFFVGTTFSLVDSYFKDADKPPGGVVLTLGIITLLLPLVLTIWAARRRWLSWPVLGASGLGAALLLTWLAWDDPMVRRPLTLEEIAPAFDGAERSHAALLEYGKLKPTAEATAFKTAKWKVDYVKGSPAEAEKWVEFLTANRANLETDWAAAAPQRAWLERLNAFERLGDLSEADFGADIPSFQIWRFLSQRTAAMASLQALDGKGDEAVATLLPMLEVSRKFETSARTLVRLMIARVAQKICYQTAGFILDRAPPGPAARARLLAALEDGNGPAGARRIILVEYAGVIAAINKVSLKEAVSLLSWGQQAMPARAFATLAIFVFNPRATANLYGDYAYELVTLAEARDLGGFAVRQEAFVHDSLQKGGMKNLGGRLLMNMAIPAYQKVLKNYWDIEDLRIALQARLSPSP
jgi:hypothetical protein